MYLQSTTFQIDIHPINYKKGTVSIACHSTELGPNASQARKPTPQGPKRLNILITIAVFVGLSLPLGLKMSSKKDRNPSLFNFVFSACTAVDAVALFDECLCESTTRRATSHGRPLIS